MNYTTAQYTVAVEVPRTPAEVFSCLTHEVAKFWPEEFEGTSAQLNDEFIFRTGDNHYSKNKVTELVKDRRIVWLVTESIRMTDGFDWTGTKMIFDISPLANNTLFKFTYDGVVLENESDRLAQICDITIKGMFYNFIVNGIRR